jgi:hypothetical protein
MVVHRKYRDTKTLRPMTIRLQRPALSPPRSLLTVMFLCGALAIPPRVGSQGLGGCSYNDQTHECENQPGGTECDDGTGHAGKCQNLGNSHSCECQSRSPEFGTCVFDPGKNSCVIKDGRYCSSGNGAGTCGMGENACWCYLPNYTLDVASFNPTWVNPGGQASSTVTIAQVPGSSGYLGNVDLSCTGPLACSLSPSTVTTSGGRVTSTLTVSTAMSTAAGNYVIKVNAHDVSPNSGPANGPQGVTLKVAHPNGGGTIALCIFLFLFVLWTAIPLYLRREWMFNNLR